MRRSGERCSAQIPSSGYFCDTGANGRYNEEVCRWNGDTVAGISKISDSTALESDLCFFDFDFGPSSAWSLFRFFSPCEDFDFFSDFRQALVSDKAKVRGIF